MPYCPKCGVQVDNNRDKCPLCSMIIPKIEEAIEDTESREQHLLNRYLIKQKENRIRWREARFFVYTGIAISLIILSFIFGIQDYYFSGNLSWSKYVIIGNMTALISLFFILKFIPFFIPNFIGLGLTTAGLLYILDNMNGKLDWFWDLGLVICINTMVWSLILRHIIRHSHRRGLNIPAYTLFAVALASLSLQIIGNLYKGVPIHLTWSIPIISSLIPLGGLLLVIHLLLSRGIQDKLKRRFHL
jgi:hypothetical protein